MSAEEVDALLARLGGYGRYQVLQYIGLGFIYGGDALNIFVLVFLAWPPEHHCTPWRNHTLHQSLPLDKEMRWSQCSMYQDPGSEGEPHGNTTVSCQLGWTYVWDREGETSTVSDWDLVCERGYLSQLPVSAFMAGAACGTAVLTPLSDRWGRKVVVVSSVLLQAVLGLVIAFVQGPIEFAVLQFLQGGVNTTSGLCALLLVVEIFDKRTRLLPCYSITFFWSGAIMLTSLFAYLLRKWQHLQLAGTLFLALRLLYVCCLPESTSWLLATGKTARAREVILHILRVNKLPPLDDLDETLNKFKAGSPAPREVAEVSPENDAVREDKNLEESAASETVLDLFRTPRRCRYSVFMFYLCFTTSLAYFGISFSMPLLSGDKYINNLLSGAVEYPAHLACILFNQSINPTSCSYPHILAH